MASRIEKRTLKERIEATGKLAYKLGTPKHVSGSRYEWQPLKGRELTTFNTLLKRTKEFARFVRSKNPDDRAWESYDRHLEKIADYQDDYNHRERHELSHNATQQLHNAIGMILGALERTDPFGGLSKHTHTPENKITLRGTIAHFYSKMLNDNLSVEQRYENRQVLADKLEELGYEGEANAIRAHKWNLDRKVGESLGLPRYEYEKKPRKYEESRIHSKALEDIVNLRRHEREYPHVKHLENESRKGRKARDKTPPRRTPKKSRAWDRTLKSQRMFRSSRVSGIAPRSRSGVTLMAGRPKRRRKMGKRRSRRDWKGHSREHATASRKGWRRVAKKSWRPKRRSSARRRTSRRDWPGHPRLHSRASKLGWRRRKARHGGYRRKRSYASTGFKRKSFRRRRSTNRMSAAYKAGRARNRFAQKAYANRRRAARVGRRDWPGQPIRHMRASKLGWKRKRRGHRSRHY